MLTRRQAYGKWVAHMEVSGVPGGEANGDKYWIQMGPSLLHSVWASGNVVSGGPQAQRLRKCGCVLQGQGKERHFSAYPQLGYP